MRALPSQAPRLAPGPAAAQAGRRPRPPADAPPHAAERLTWESNGGPPVPVTVDGKDHFLGRVRAVHADDQLFVVLVDAGDVHFRWRTPPLGSYSDGYRSTWFAAAGGKVVVSDHKG